MHRHITVLELVVLVLLFVACGQKKEPASDSASSATAEEEPVAVPAWADALASKELKYVALLNGGDEVSLDFRFEKPSVAESGKSVLVPVTMSYTGGERPDAMSAKVLGVDDVERDVEVKNAKLPSSGAKREASFKIPLKSAPKRLTLTAGSLRVQLEFEGSGWRVAADEFTKRRSEALALTECCEALKKANDADKAYKFAHVTCGLSLGEVIKGQYTAQETRRLVGDMVKKEKKEVPTACAPVESSKP